MVRRKGLHLFGAVVPLALVLLCLAGATPGAHGPLPPVAPDSAGPRLMPAALPEEGRAPGPWQRWWEQAPAGPTDRIEVLVQLDEPPLAEVYARFTSGKKPFDPMAMAAALPYLERIEQQQAALREALTGPPIRATILCAVQRVYNGIGVQVAAGKLAAIRKLPGVKGVHVMAPMTPALDTSVSWIGAPQVWERFGRTGAGVTIALIDTGIDYTHSTFGGTGGKAAYAANNPAVIEAGTFPTAKVIGGFDFAGGTFNPISANPEDRIPRPDPDPLDQNGHGTALAAIAAGFGAKNPPYDGALDPSVYQVPLEVYPGVAPRSTLASLGVAGIEGVASFATVGSALDWVMDPNRDGSFADRVEIALMGFAVFGVSASLPLVEAARNAVNAGVLVVAPAGNTKAHYSAGGAGLAEGAVSVAETFDNGYALQSVTLVDPTDPASSRVFRGVIPGFGPRLKEEITAPVGVAFPRNGCSRYTNAAAIDGKIALIVECVCDPVVKAQNAQDAGAVAALIAYGNELPLAVKPFGRSDAIRIPVLLMATPVIAEIEKMVSARGQATLRISPILNPLRSVTGLLNPSSGSGGDFCIPGQGPVVKPDLSAPGTNILTADAGTGSGAAYVSGTSAAAAHVAGTAALVMESRKSPTAEAINNRVIAVVTERNAIDVFLMLTTGRLPNELPDVGFQTLEPPPFSFGNGQVEATRPLLPGVPPWHEMIILSRPTASFSFEPHEAVRPQSFRQEHEVVSVSASERSFSFAYRPASDIPGALFRFPDRVTVPAGGRRPFPVELVVDPAAMRHPLPPGVAPTQANVPRHYVSNESGRIEYRTATDDRPRRLTVSATVRPAADMSATPERVRAPAANGSFVLNLAGTGLNTGSRFPVDLISLVSAFALQEQSPDEPASLGYLNHSDLKSIGVRSDRRARTRMADTTILFGIATHGEWNTPNDVFFSVLIDTDRDGRSDFQLFTSSLPTEFGPSDVFLTRLRDLRTGQIRNAAYPNLYRADQFDSALFNTNVIEMPVKAADLGLTDANATFVYQVTTQIGPMVIDRSRSHSFNVAGPGLEFGPALIFFDLPGRTIPVTFTGAELRANGIAGVLLLHHHNPAGRRDQVVPVTLN
jgi:subtilisin family serine protease